MIEQPFLSSYPAKLMEYGLGAAYLALFVPFWRYVQGGRRAERISERFPERAAGATALPNAGWFHVPADILLHPGHTWARMGKDGLVDVGLDEFAARLLGPLERLTLPEPGAPLTQGLSALLATHGDRSVALVSPVCGTVAEVNRQALLDERWLHEPYGAGRLLKVRPSRMELDEKRLFAGEMARRWVEQASESLAARLPTRVGAVLQDGGGPVHGISRELEPERWDELCRDYFRT